MRLIDPKSLCCPHLARHISIVEERLHRLRTQMEIWELEEQLEQLKVQATCNFEEGK